MENKQWLELINQKKSQLVEAGEQAFRDSIDNQHLRYIVELYKDGSISVWYDVAGGNSFTSSSHRGESYVVMQFCHQYMEINNQEDETEEEWIEWYKDEYAHEEADQKLDREIEELEYYVKMVTE